MKKLMLFLVTLLAIGGSLFAQQPATVLFGSGAPGGGVAFIPGTHYVDNSVSPAVTYICSSVSVAAGPTPPAGTQTCNWTQIGGSSVSPTGIPGTAGVTAVPVQSGLMAEYRMFPTETCGGLLDYSGNAANATGTVGTAPTIIANTGGCNFTGNGAVSLPASLNSARTIMVYAAFQGNGLNGQQAFVQGNGAGASTGGSGFWLLVCGAGLPGGCLIGSYGIVQPISPNNGRLYTWGNNLQNTASLDVVNGAGVFTEVMDTADRIYVNGKEEIAVSYIFQRGAGSAGGQTTGNYQLGGAGAGIGQNTDGANPTTWYNGQIYYAVFWNRVLNPSEVASASAYLQSAMLARGIKPPTATPTAPLMSASDSTNQFVAQGTSITAGNGLTPYTTPLVNGLNGGPWNIMNTGFPGQTCAAILANADLATDPAVRPAANKNAIVVECGTNDSVSTAALAETEVGRLRNHCLARQAVGFKCLNVTMVSRSGIDANKNFLNAAMRSRWPTFSDGLVDMGASPLGADGASGTAALFSDGVHPTQYGFHNIYAPIVQRAVNRLYGNLDFSSATVYVAPALAATATTAGTEAGNTITITFGATPANCQVGNMITLSGITPVGLGYNDTFLILTRSATQITAWSSVTGLGAITVQGTGVCPQMQDADTYSVLNFGAGNFTLQSCVGYTGQNIYIRNINAAATTLVPMPTGTFNGTAETITGGGAAPTTLAANSTAILQSQLVSSAAAGCNWVRLQ